ncbi:MAG: CPBP family intramembrane metalloprotease [Planctomycetes bacterium]|nr:CPBP family intramembrane metalloprotease [Planctomycetota bacterium]
MTAPSERVPAREPIGQAVAAAGTAVIAYNVNFYAGIALLLVLVTIWPPKVSWRPLAWRTVLAVYPPFLLLWLGFAIAYLRAMAAIDLPVPPQPLLDQLAHGGLALPNAGFALFGIVVLAPVWEEILFRGYLFTALAAALPRLLTHLLTAAIFGLVHGLHYALPIGVLALLFGWLRARHNALLPSILAHALHNGATVALAMAFPEALDWMYLR